MVRPVLAGQRAGICGVSPAEDPEVSDADRAGNEALQQRALSGMRLFLLMTRNDVGKCDVREYKRHLCAKC